MTLTVQKPLESASADPEVANSNPLRAEHSASLGEISRSLKLDQTSLNMRY